MQENLITRLLEGGARQLRDDEVEDRGDYVLWKDFDPTYIFIGELSERYVDSVANLMTLPGGHFKNCVFYPAKPLRVRAILTYANGEPSLSSYWVHVESHEQMFTISGDNPRTGISTYHVENCAWGVYRFTTGFPMWKVTASGALTCIQRQAYATHIMFSADERLSLAGRRYLNNSDRVAPFTSTRRSSSSPVGGRLYSSVRHYPQARRALHEFGHRVARARAGDSSVEPSDVVFLLEDVNHYSPELARIACDGCGWNDECILGDEVCIADCGHVELEDNTHPLHNGGSICQACADDGDDYIIPEDDCGTYYRRSDLYCHSNDEFYTYPEDEDEDEEDDEYPEGVQDYGDDVLASLDRDFSIKPSPYGDFLMGIELEVAPLRGYAQECVNATQADLCDGYAILKHDASLDEHHDYASGFEIVTAPRGLAEHIKRFEDWEPHDKLRAWDAACCGMHVHLSSQGFSPAAFGKFLEFINSASNDDFVKDIAGRHPSSNSQAADYCQREGVLVPGNPKATAKGKSPRRYHMVNTQNLTAREAGRLGVGDPHERWHAASDYNTVELRIFRATLKKSRMLAQIEFAHAAVMFCRWASMRELDREHFVLWLRGMAGVYPHLAKWLGVRANKAEIQTDLAAKTHAECEV